MKSKEEINSDTENIKSDPNDVRNDIADKQDELSDAEVEVTDPVSKLEAALTSANDKYLRLYSDFENYKKRIARDRIEQSKMAGADIFLSFLPVIDDLERAIKSIENSTAEATIREGLMLIYSKIKGITTSKGLTEMNSVGEPFDADLHDAIANAPVQDEKMKGKIVEEIEKGYFYNEKVIRHAKVIVGN